MQAEKEQQEEIQDTTVPQEGMAQEEGQDIQNAEQSQEVEKEQSKRKDAGYNFAELRKKTEAMERALEQERREKQEMMVLLKQHMTPSKKPVDDDDDIEKLSMDDLPTVKDVKKMNKRETKELKGQVQMLQQQLEEMKFKNKYSDFDDIVTDENIAYLKKEEPELADALAKLPQGSYDQAIAAYKYIKTFLPSKQPESVEKKKALENSKKPVSVQSVAKTSPIGMANAFATMNPSKDEKAAIYREMQEAMKRG